MNVDQELLFNLVLAANFMDIQPLLDLTCAATAATIKSKSVDDIRKVFNIVAQCPSSREEVPATV